MYFVVKSLWNCCVRYAKLAPPPSPGDISLTVSVKFVRRLWMLFLSDVVIISDGYNNVEANKLITIVTRFESKLVVGISLRRDDDNNFAGWVLRDSCWSSFSSSRKKKRGKKNQRCLIALAAIVQYT